MSRRPGNAASDRAAQNQQTLKSLVKLEGNKSCADCKRNKREFLYDCPSKRYITSSAWRSLCIGHYDLTDEQIQDGRVGIWVFLSAFGVCTSGVAWPIQLIND